MNNTIIIGGGITGLYTALRLRTDQNITLIEKEKSLGGLCRTFNFGGNKTDIGGHRIFFNDIEKFVRFSRAINLEYMEIEKKSKIFINGKFYNYPPTVLFLKNHNLIKIGISFLKSKLKKQKTYNLEDWLIKKYGKALYDMYFKPYSEKIWGTECKNISYNWAEKRIGSDDLINNYLRIFLKSGSKEYIKKFFYPPLGIESICEKMYHLLKEKVSFITGSKIEKIYCKGNRVSLIQVRDKKGSKYYKCDRLISTIPLTELINLFEPKPRDFIILNLDKIKYKDLIIVFIVVNMTKITDYHWVYFPQKEIIFSRIHEPKNWSIKMVKSIKNSSICCEILHNQNDNIELNLIKKEVINQLNLLGLIKSSQIKEVQVKKIQYAYPFQYKGYDKPLNEILKYLSTFENLSLAGRQGLHRYYDIEECFESVERII